MMASSFARSWSGLKKIKGFSFLFNTKRLHGDFASSLVFEEYGDPSAVLQIREFDISDTLADSEVLVEMLAAPINPADINTIQGAYAIKPKLPAIAGFEGVGKVVRIGGNVSGLQINDWVLPVGAGITGTWATHRVWKQHDLKKIPNDLPLISAATISVNPSTAYRMLKDFENLQPGDTVIQNGANSAVGQAVIQIAKQMGYVTINLVRSRPDMDKFRQWMKQLGADHIVDVEQLRKPETVDLLKSLPKPKLGFNCTGGKIATDMTRLMADGATMVTYGGMSRQPLTIPTGALIFKDLKVRGFWMTHWKKTHPDSPEWDTMLQFLIDMVRKGKLAPPACTELMLDDFRTGVQKATEPFVSHKQIFVFNRRLRYC